MRSNAISSKIEHLVPPLVINSPPSGYWIGGTHTSFRGRCGQDIRTEKISYCTLASYSLAFIIYLACIAVY